ncbi:hypothetical protein VTI74DRAFT_8212 [Chaetomium olivicolor]
MEMRRDLDYCQERGRGKQLQIQGLLTPLGRANRKIQCHPPKPSLSLRPIQYSLNPMNEKTNPASNWVKSNESATPTAPR